MAQLVAPLVSIHVVGLPDPYRLPYESASFVCFSINHLGILPVYHMIRIANMICDCRFVADTGCPGLFCSSEDSCDAIHFFTMFFYSCSPWPSCFCNVDTFTVFTRYRVKTVNVPSALCQCIFTNQQSLVFCLTKAYCSFNRGTLTTQVIR